MQHQTGGAAQNSWGTIPRGGPPCPDPAVVTGEMAVPYYMGRASDWVAREDELAAILPMVLLGLSRYRHRGDAVRAGGSAGPPDTPLPSQRCH